MKVLLVGVTTTRILRSTVVLGVSRGGDGKSNRELNTIVVPKVANDGGVTKGPSVLETSDFVLKFK